MAGFPRFRRTAALLAMATGLPCVGCQSALMTSAANVLGAYGSTPSLAEADEEKLGAQSYAKLLRQSRTSHPEYQAVVEKVGRRLADSSGKSNLNWEFTVLAGPKTNACCLPGGKVVIYEGLLPLCENEAGLAAVMSHEMGHMIARHGGERMKEPAVVHGLVDAIGGTAAEDETEEGQKRLLMLAAYGMASPSFTPHPFSRSQETQADSIGLMMMARAGYNPEEAPMFWRRFQSGSKSATPELLSIHPSDARRIDNLVDLLSQAEQYYAGAPNKLDRGANIAKLQPTHTPAKTTVTKVQSAPPATTPAPKAEVVSTAAFVPPEIEPSQPAAKPAPAWIGASPAVATQEQFFSEPESKIVNDVEPENPFFTPAATATPVSDSGWTPTVH